MFFGLKTGTDNFKHSSAKFFTVFLDFLNAFGRLSHDVTLYTLDEISLPQPYVDLIKNVYSNSYVQVICGSALTGPIPLNIGIKTRCPWSDESVIHNMLLCTDDFIRWSGLDMKHTKCAAFHERWSRGNRWYISKSNKPPVFLIACKPIHLYERHETYSYLGHKFSVSSYWKEQSCVMNLPENLH